MYQSEGEIVREALEVPHLELSLSLSKPTTDSKATMIHTTPPAVKAITSNPVKTRDDLVNLLHDLLTPLQAGQSKGGARIRIGHTGTHFDQVAAELEGYARALWGLAPLLASEPDHPKFRGMKQAWTRGLDNGTNPDHEEYWGDHIDMDQRFVEMAAIVSAPLVHRHVIV